MNENNLLAEQAVRALNMQEAIATKIADLKDAQEEIDDIWKQIESSMIENDVKQVKGVFGTLTIAERLYWTTTDELASKFYKKVIDSKKLSDTYRLEGKVPKGAQPNVTKYLMKRLKSEIAHEVLNG